MSTGKKKERTVAVSGPLVQRLEAENVRLVKELSTLQGAEAAVRLSEERYRQVVRDLHEYVVRWKPDGTRTFVNPRYCEAFGQTEEELLGTTFWPLISDKDRKRVRARLDRLTPDRPVSTDEHRVRLPGGGEGWQEWTDRGIFDDDGRLVELQSVGRDITARKQAEDELRASRDRLRSLALELTVTEERERRALATALHDGLGQDLALIAMKLGELDRESASDTQRQAIQGALDLVRRVKERSHDLTLELSPPILHELGIEATAEWIGGKICAEHSVEFGFEDDGQRKPLDEVTTALLFRGARELLMNVVKHADADRVALSTRRSDGWIHLTVEDDGAGFDVAEQHGSNGRIRFGLLSLRERLRQLGGRLEIESEPGRGTRISLIAPLNLGSE